MSGASGVAPPPSALDDILAAVRNGAGGTGAVCQRTGLDPEVVETGLAALADFGLIRRVLVFAGGCAGSGCGGCSAASGCGSANTSLVGSGLTAWRAS